MEDALLSPISFAMLSGAGLLGGESTVDLVHVHTTSYAVVEKDQSGATIDLSDALATSEYICPDAPVFIMKSAADGAIYGEALVATSLTGSTKVLTLDTDSAAKVENGDTVFVDYYVVKAEKQVTELQIDMEHFGGFYYVEADTLYRFQEDGQDYPAVITLPNVKIQSNFTFSMAATGDPSTFTFTMDAFPGYTYFDKTRKVLCVIQVIDAAGETADIKSVMRHGDGVKITDEKENGMKDSLPKDYVDSSDMSVYAEEASTNVAPYTKAANSKDDTSNP